MQNKLDDRQEMLKGYAAVLTTALLWSIGGVLIKLIPWAAMSINAGRCLVALLVKALYRRSFKIKWSRKVVLAGVFFALTTIFFSSATKLTTAAIAILLQYSAPFFVMIYALVWERKRPSGLDIITSLVVVGGLVLCCLSGIRGGSALGTIFGLISGACFAMMLYVNASEGSDPDSANFLGLAICVLVGFPSVLKETDFSFNTLLLVFLLGAFQLGISYIILEYGIKRVTAISATFLTALEPILNPVWVAIFYGEKIGALTIAGGALVLSASLVYGVLTARRAQTEPQ